MSSAFCIPILEPVNGISPRSFHKLTYAYGYRSISDRFATITVEFKQHEDWRYMQKKPFVLIVCDGWGASTAVEGNAIAQANTPRLDALFEDWPHAEVYASGDAVGLPASQQGNSEVGHLTIGSGRIIRQPLSRQNHEIESGSFYENKVLIDAIRLALSRGTALHLIGLVSPGGVHSHTSAAIATIELAKRLGLTDVNIHAFTDGRDTPPRSALGFIEELEARLADIGVGRIRSVSGRYYAMDRDKRWDRTKLAYDLLVNGESKTAETATAIVQQSYDEGISDEFIVPTAIASEDEDRTIIGDGDVVVFFNFRPDRARQLSHALVDSDFDHFERGRIVSDLHFVSFAEYDSQLNVPIVFPADNANNTLAEVISEQGLRQYHVAETEKYAHVTYFLNGGREEPFEGEDRKMIPSPKVATYDTHPEMSAREVADEVLSAIKGGEYDFIAVNFANADMVGHTGDFDATVHAIEFLDDCVSDVLVATLEAGGAGLMTADHGNAETMLDAGEVVTSHTTSKVPVLLCGTSASKIRDGGGLSDVAPTILESMGLDIPDEMTGASLANLG